MGAAGDRGGWGSASVPVARNLPRPGPCRTGLASADAIAASLRPTALDAHHRHARVRSCSAESMPARRHPPRPATAALTHRMRRPPPLFFTSRYPTVPDVAFLDAPCDPSTPSVLLGAAADSQGRMDRPKTRLKGESVNFALPRAPRSCPNIGSMPGTRCRRSRAAVPTQGVATPGSPGARAAPRPREGSPQWLERHRAALEGGCERSPAPRRCRAASPADGRRPVTGRSSV
jgi:hypothetical protein